MIHLSDCAADTYAVWYQWSIGTQGYGTYDEEVIGLAMNVSGSEIQIMFCVLILLGLLSVALVVDYLKGMNEKLRERHIDLLARHETVVHQVEDDNARLLRALAEQSKAFREMTKRPIAISTFAQDNSAPAISIEPIAQIAAEPSAPLMEEMAAPESSELEQLVETASATPQPVRAEELPPNVIRIRLMPDTSRTSAKPEAVREAGKDLESSASPVAESAGKEVAKPDFESLMDQLVTEFDASPNNRESAAAIEALALVVGAQTPAVAQGQHSPAALNQWLERNQTLSGLVVCIGINDYLNLDEILGEKAAGNLLNSVEDLIQSLAGESGFRARKSDDEFVLIYPNLAGARAQQRLSEISEQLWDYQLQTLGTYSFVFSWGASEAQHQPLAEAMATASENMVETRNSRKSASADRSGLQRVTA